MYVSSNLDIVKVEKTKTDVYINQLFIDGRTYLILTPGFYSWARKNVETANVHFKSGKLSKEAWESLRKKFIVVHEYTLSVFTNSGINKALKGKHKPFVHSGAPILIKSSDRENLDCWLSDSVVNSLCVGALPRKVAGLENLEYVLIYSELLKEKIVLLFVPKSFNKIYSMFPNTAIYFPSEIQVISKLTGKEILRAHKIKKEFNGFITNKKKVKGVRNR